MIADILYETLLDSLKQSLPLFAAFLLLGYLEVRASQPLIDLLYRSRRLSPVVGGALGCIPQCGFSVAAATLYNYGIITAGTLIAVFISTSDEAIPVLLVAPEGLPVILRLILVKFLFAIAFGYLLDIIIKKEPVVPASIDMSMGKQRIVLTALKRTLLLLLILAAVSFLLSLGVEHIGIDYLSSLTARAGLFVPFVTAAVGLIPNCAVSVVLTELYLEGILSFGAAVSGLCSSAGLGLLVLFKRGCTHRKILMLVLYLYLCAVLSGVIVQLIGL